MCGDLKVLEPDCEALYALHSISDIPDQEIDGSVGEETLVGQVVLLLIERERDQTTLFFMGCMRSVQYTCSKSEVILQ